MKHTRTKDDLIEKLKQVPYTPVADRAAQAEQAAQSLQQQGVAVQTMRVKHREVLQNSFWSNEWRQHMEVLTHDQARLNRGKTYLGQGVVNIFPIKSNSIAAKVQGKDEYNIRLDFKPLSELQQTGFRDDVVNTVVSADDLLQPNPSAALQQALTHRDHGVFPRKADIKVTCSCPDKQETQVNVCKHIAATFYGAGEKIATSPKLLYILRNVKLANLVPKKQLPPRSARNSAGVRISSLFKKPGAGVQKHAARAAVVKA